MWSVRAESETVLWFHNDIPDAFLVGGDGDVGETGLEFGAVEKIVLFVLVHHFTQFFHKGVEEAHHPHHPGRDRGKLRFPVHFFCNACMLLPR